MRYFNFKILLLRYRGAVSTQLFSRQFYKSGAKTERLLTERAREVAAEAEHAGTGTERPGTTAEEKTLGIRAVNKIENIVFVFFSGCFIRQ